MERVLLKKQKPNTQPWSTSEPPLALGNGGAMWVAFHPEAKAPCLWPHPWHIVAFLWKSAYQYWGFQPSVPETSAVLEAI